MHALTLPTVSRLALCQKRQKQAVTVCRSLLRTASDPHCTDTHYSVIAALCNRPIYVNPVPMVCQRWPIVDNAGSALHFHCV